MSFRFRALRIILIVLAVAAAGYTFRGQLFALFFRPQAPPQTQAGISRAQLDPDDLEVIAEGLQVPWELAFLPDGSLLVTERRGRLVHLVDGERRVISVAGVREAGEGGLMGLALHPEFPTNQLIYVCFTADADGGLENRVERHRLQDGRLSEGTVILSGIPGAHFHDGCRLAFGPDRYLYITTGDAGGPERAQDRSSLAGKILRLTDDGKVPEGNPFRSPVYAYGSRNSQGLAWDERGRLWSTEHGRSGMRSGYDELNLIEAGKNYGWPKIQGGETAPGMVAPVLHSGPGYTWAPGGAAYADGRVFFGGLRGEALYEARLSEGRRPELRVHFPAEFGRIRAVRLGPDGMLYFATSNRDNRGRVRSGDDKIVRVDPAVFR